MNRLTNRTRLATVLLIAVIAAGISAMGPAGKQTLQKLPKPDLTGSMTLEQALEKRRSVRDFNPQPLTTKQIAQLCWAGQGITDRRSGYRTAPSAGALYPIELYVVTPDGVGHYRPQEHVLKTIATGDLRQPLQQAGLDQDPIGKAPAVFVITAVVERTARKYHRRAERYCFLEAGHVAQNILLQATALELGGVSIGAFEDDKVASVLGLDQNQRVLYIMPIGPAH